MCAPTSPPASPTRTLTGRKRPTAATAATMSISSQPPSPRLLLRRRPRPRVLLLLAAASAVRAAFGEMLSGSGCCTSREDEARVCAELALKLCPKKNGNGHGAGSGGGGGGGEPSRGAAAASARGPILLDDLDKLTIHASERLEAKDAIRIAFPEAAGVVSSAVASEKDLAKLKKREEAAHAAARAAADAHSLAAASAARGSKPAIRRNAGAGGARDLRLGNVCVSNGGSDLIRNADLLLAAGRRYGLVGKNGAGKSTLLRALAAREVPGIPPNMQILHVEAEVPGDKEATPLDVLLEADVERAELLEEEAELLRRLGGGAEGGEVSAAASAAAASAAASADSADSAAASACFFCCCCCCCCFRERRRRRRRGRRRGRFVDGSHLGAPVPRLCPTPGDRRRGRPGPRGLHPLGPLLRRRLDDQAHRQLLGRVAHAHLAGPGALLRPGRALPRRADLPPRPALGALARGLFVLLPGHRRRGVARAGFLECGLYRRHPPGEEDAGSLQGELLDVRVDRGGEVRRGFFFPDFFFRGRGKTKKNSPSPLSRARTLSLSRPLFRTRPDRKINAAKAAASASARRDHMQASQRTLFLMRLKCFEMLRLSTNIFF